MKLNPVPGEIRYEAKSLAGLILAYAIVGAIGLVVDIAAKVKELRK